MNFKQRANTKDWGEVTTAMGVDDSLRFTYASMWSGRQIKTGETVAILAVKDPDAAKLVQQSWSKLSIDVCYCSIYQECWVKSVSKVVEPVSVCPSGAPTGFPRSKSAS